MNHSSGHQMYFIAIVCPPELDKKILQHKLWMKEHYDCTVALKSPAHITLVPPFWMEEAQEQELKAILSSFKPEIKELHIHLDGYSHFSNRVLFVQVKENLQLHQLKQAAENHFRKNFSAIKPDERPFHPHLTIASRDLKPSAFIKAWEHFSKMPFDESFFTESISLLKLEQGKWSVIATSKF